MRSRDRIVRAQGQVPLKWSAGRLWTSLLMLALVHTAPAQTPAQAPAQTAAQAPAQTADEWRAVEVPAAWETQADGELADYDGFGWYRCYVSIPERWRGIRLLLTIGRTDNVDEAYFNGQKIGAYGSPPPLYQHPSSGFRRPYVIDPDVIRPGEANLLTVRVYDESGDGGIIEGPIQLVAGDEALELSGIWQFRAGDNMLWKDWPVPVNDKDARRELAAAYRKQAGDHHAGHKSIGPAQRDALLHAQQVVLDRYDGNTNPNALSDDKGAPTPPAQAAQRLKVAEGLAVDVVAHEPAITQPLEVKFDERGRMWVVQYRQYPDPAGLKVITFDDHLRKIFDRDPPPPPNHFVGKDKITIHEDTDGDGVFESHKTFVDGLNIATSVLPGDGGVWVMNTPYLLFYPDADHDDVPDGDPVVHLSGFGLEDTHSVANSLKFGPDGWIYGAQGSTCTARVKAHLNPNQGVTPFLGQAIWRYHPTRHVFELFAEGGFNSFGVDFDDKGRVYSGTNSWQRGVHFVQGGYFQKSWGKHGPLTNPFAYGYFDAMPHEGDRTRLTHQFVIYGADELPGYRGKLIGVNSLANWVMTSSLDPWGSTYKTVDIDKTIETDDRWFRPVHITHGPDGALYISDWYDARITHLDPRDNWDHERGRVYRLRGENYEPAQPINLRSASSDQLVSYLMHPNRWYRQTALRLIAERADRSVLPRLMKMLRGDDGQASLEALWAIYRLGDLTEIVTLEALGHEDPFVRLWAARLLGDEVHEVHEVDERDDGNDRKVTSAIAERLVAMAAAETHVQVRSQLSATATRLPGDVALPIIWQLVQYESDVEDAYIPMQLWWAVEDKAISHRELVLATFNHERAWRCPIVATIIMPRLIKRYAAEPTEANLNAATKLLDGAPGEQERDALLAALGEAFAGRPVGELPAALQSALMRAPLETASTEQAILRARSGDDRAIQYMIRFTANDDPAVKQRRIRFIEALGQLGTLEAVSPLLAAARTSRWHSVRRASLSSLQRFNDDAIARAIIEAYDELPTDQGVRPTAIEVLSRRLTWASLLLQAVDTGDIPRTDVPIEIVERIKRFDEAQITSLVTRLWGQTRATPQENQSRIEEVAAILKAGQGDIARGQTHFTNLCARCHTLFGEGAAVAPDLTGYERENTDFLLLSIIDPNAAIREEYTDFEIETADFLILTGFIKDQTPDTVTLEDGQGAMHTLSRDDIVSTRAINMSRMPEGLLDAMSPQDIRDLFAFLQSQPVSPQE